MRGVGLVDRFSLLQLERDDGTRTFLAHETATSRPVQVHLFPHTDPRNAKLLAALARAPKFVQQQILDRGYHEGIPYVVTLPLGHQMSLREWMAAVDRISAFSVSLEKQFAGLFEGRMEEAPRQSPGNTRGQWKVVVPRTMQGPAAAAKSAGAGSCAILESVELSPAKPLFFLPATEPPAVETVASQSLSHPRLRSYWHAAARPGSTLQLVGKRFLAMVLGVGAALVFLGLIAALWAFRAH